MADSSTLDEVVERIVVTTDAMLQAHLPHIDARISYCAVFCKSDAERDSFLKQLPRGAVLADTTATGPVYIVPAIATVRGSLRVLKIRNPDSTRTERGDADYAVSRYSDLKAAVLGRAGFQLIQRADYQMIELLDEKYDARVYFSDPPVEQHARIAEALAQQP
jgi:hypothetical protein